MSKTFRTDSDYNDKKQLRHLGHLSKHANNIANRRNMVNHDFTHTKFDPKHFLAEIKSVRFCKGTLNHSDKDTLKYWLNHLQLCFSDEEFTGKTLFQFIRRLNGMMRDNKEIHAFVIHYCESNPSFCERFLECALTSLNDLNSDAYSYMLSFLTYTHILPDQSWLTRWLERTDHKLNYFTENDFYELEAVCSLVRSQHYDVEAWIRKWFEKTEGLIKDMPNEYLGQVIFFVGMLRVEPPATWSDECIKRSSEFLKELPERQLFRFSTAFFLECVRANREVSAEWFRRSLLEMNATDVYDVMKSLLPLVHANIDIPPEWMDAWMKKVLADFDKIAADPLRRGTGISHSLYALVLMQKDIAFCLPFLEKCNASFKNYEGSFLKQYEYRHFRKIIFSKNYFELFGIELPINPSDYPALTNKIRQAPKKSSRTQAKFGRLLTALFGALVKEEEFVSVIFDNVDFLIVDNFIVEVDGHHHYIKGQPNALTRAKTLMLERAGYTVKRFSVDTVASKDSDLLNLLKMELTKCLHSCKSIG